MDSRRVNSKKQENKVAKELSGKVTPASGALWGAKADVRNDIFLVECKTTGKDFYSLTYDTWNKIYKEAIKDGLRIPVMCIDLNNGKDRYAVMCTKDIGNYPPSCSFREAIKQGGSKSFRLRGVCRFYIENKTGGYDLQSIPWGDFLETVVPEYA